MAAPAVLPFKVRRSDRHALREAERKRQHGFKLAIDRVDRVLTTYETRIERLQAQVKRIQARIKHAQKRCTAVEDATLEFMTEAGLGQAHGQPRHAHETGQCPLAGGGRFAARADELSAHEDQH